MPDQACESLSFTSQTMSYTGCLKECLCTSQSDKSKKLMITWFLIYYTGKKVVPGIRDTIYHHIIYKLLSKHYEGWSLLEEAVQLRLPFCYKSYIVLLRKHAQNSTHPLQHPAMEVTVPHVTLLILTLQSLWSIFNHVQSFFTFNISPSSYCPIFVLFCPLFCLLSLFIFF